MKLYLQSIRNPNIRFEIVSYNVTTEKGIVKSLRYGSTFEETLNKDTLQRMGYRVEKVEQHHEHSEEENR